MPTMLSPGVYVIEADHSDYAVDTSTCIIGMVGGATHGPVGRPVLITSQKQMVETFGEPVEGEYGVYSALQALTKSSQLYYVRVVRKGTKASCGIIGDDKIIYTAKAIGSDYNGYKVEQTALTEGKFSVTIKDKDDNVIEEYKDLSIEADSENYVGIIINSQSDIVDTTIENNGSVEEKTFILGSETSGVGSGTYAFAGKKGKDKLILRSKYYDSDINGCSVIISDLDSFGYFAITITNSGGGVIEEWKDLSLKESSPRYVEKLINNGSDRFMCAVDPSEDVKFESGTLVFMGGDAGINGITTGDIIGEVDGTGLYAFSNKEDVLIDILMAPGWSDQSVISAGLSICSVRNDCLYLIDPPFGLSPQEVLNWSNATGDYADRVALNNDFGAVYWPWVKVYDTYTEKMIWLPPSGFVAAQYCYNDTVGYPWNAPAGLNRGIIENAVAVEMSPTQGERDALYGNRNVVNPIVNFISSGIVIWGQKTTQRNPTALDRVNVRRLMNYLERNIATVTKGYVFEQNVDATWERWRTVVEPILQNVKSNGGLYEYKIVAQATASDIENNRMPIVIYVKPTKTAEFISITFNIESYSADLSQY